MYTDRTYPYPRTWSEMSTDFKLMFGFHLCMMVLFVFGATVGVLSQLLIAGSLLAVAIAISAWRKLAAGWRWPGIGLREIAGAFISVLLTGLLMFAATPLAPPNSPITLPWYLAGAGIGFFNTALDLKLVTYSKAEFLAQCGDPSPTSDDEPQDAQWRSILRHAYSVAFLAVWLTGIAFIYMFGVGIRDGSGARTLIHTEPLMNHGHTVYVSATDKSVIELLQSIMMVGLPGILIVGAVLHFILKIPVFGPPTKKD